MEPLILGFSGPLVINPPTQMPRAGSSVVLLFLMPHYHFNAYLLLPLIIWPTKLPLSEIKIQPQAEINGISFGPSVKAGAKGLPLQQLPGGQSEF